MEVSHEVIDAPQEATTETFGILSDCNWSVAIPESASWLTAVPASGRGNGTVTLTFSANTGTQRQVDIVILTPAGNRTITVIQNGLETTSIGAIDFGTSGGRTPILDNSDWGAIGIGVAGLAFSGTGFLVTGPESTGYPGASGGANVLLETVGDFIQIDNWNVNTGSVATYTLTFGSFSGVSGDHPLILEMSADAGATWSTVLYLRDENPGWRPAFATFDLPATQTNLSLRFTAATAPVNIDDVMLVAQAANVTVASIPAVTTVQVTSGDVTETSANLAGTFTYTGSGTISAVGIAYKSGSSGVFTLQDAAGTSVIAVTLTSLLPGTTYDYYAYVRIGTDIYKGDTRIFTTPSAPLPLAFGTSVFAGTMISGAAITDAMIVIPYTNADSEVISVSVTATGPGSAGITPIVSQNFTLGRGSGDLFIEITGTPVTSGAVTFTISGIEGLTMATVTVAVGQGNEVPTTLYIENMGATPVGVNTPVAGYTGWLREGQPGAVYSASSSTVDVRITSASAGYPGASGGNNIFFGTGAPNSFIVSNLVTAGANTIELTFGVTNNVLANLDTALFTVEYSIDGGTTWIPVSYSAVNASSGIWKFATASTLLPASESLSLRFTAQIASTYRLDDIQIVGIL